MKRRLLTLLLVLCLSAALLPSVWASSVAYMPGVTEEMTDPAFWSGMAEDPNALLSTPEEIARINAAALANEGSNMHDLRNLPDRFNGAARCASLAEGAAADAAYFLGWTYDENGKEFTQEGGAMGLAGYEDSMDISDWAYEAMGWAVRCGILCGKGSGLICPKDPMTRCELALVLARAAALVLAS